MREFSLMDKNEIIGNIYVINEGLYVKIQCNLRISCNINDKLLLISQKETIDLGGFMPVGNTYCLIKRIPAKRIGEGEFHFQFQSPGNFSEKQFIPISETSPFPCISKITESTLHYENGIAGIWV